MNKEGPKRSRLREAALPAATGFLVLVACFVNFLTYNDYPLLKAEIGVIVAFFLAATLAAGLLYALAERYGRAMLQIYLALIALDLSLDGPTVVLSTIAAVILLNRRLMLVLRFVAVTAIIFAIIGFSPGIQSSEGSPTVPRADLPVLLHVILDEHIGVEGLLGDEPAVKAMRERLLTFYVGNGFRLFGGAYSEHFFTVNALPQLLNFGVEQPWNVPDARRGLFVEKNAYFDRLRLAGYGLKIYQTDFIKFCDRVTETNCHEFRQQDYGVIAETALPAAEKAKIIGAGFLALSSVVGHAARIYDAAGSKLGHYSVSLSRIALDSRSRVSNIGALNMLDHVTADLRLAQPGEAYFLHVLLPHDPYSLRADCSATPSANWRLNHSAATRYETMLAYFDQIDCLNLRLARMLDALSTSKAGNNAVIIIHGDHGYRDTRPPPSIEAIGRFSDEDLVQSYSTLFAVRAQTIQPGCDAQRFPIDLLLQTLASSDFKSAAVQASRDFSSSVVLNDALWRPAQKYPLPKWWTDQ